MASFSSLGDKEAYFCRDNIKILPTSPKNFLPEKARSLAGGKQLFLKIMWLDTEILLAKEICKMYSRKTLPRIDRFKPDFACTCTDTAKLKVQQYVLLLSKLGKYLISWNLFLTLSPVCLFYSVVNNGMDRFRFNIWIYRLECSLLIMKMALVIQRKKEIQVKNKQGISLVME